MSISIFISSCITPKSNDALRRIENSKNSGASIERIIDNPTTSSNDSIRIFEIKIDTLLSNKKFLRLQLYAPVKWMNGQDLIAYDYCNSKIECDTTVHLTLNKDGGRDFSHYELTGEVREENSHWLHPPRSYYFKILEMNAFPFFVKDKEEWEYNLDFGDHWGDERWMTWTGRNIAKTTYKLADTIIYEFGDQNLVCSIINASTKIDALGETKSAFYYNQRYGFVYMLFKTINNQNIEFKMI